MILTNRQINYIANILKNTSIKNEELNELLSEGNIITDEKTSLRDICEILSPTFGDVTKKNSGIVFTPLKVAINMYSNVLMNEMSYGRLSSSKIVDFSSGNGVFLIAVILLLKKENPNLSVRAFIEKNLYAYDIQTDNIEFLNLNLKIITEYFGEDSTNMNIQSFVGDTLSLFCEGEITDNFDLIVGNPPYVKQQNLSLKTRSFLKNNFQTVNSNYNLYYAFIELSIKKLLPSGHILLLVPNYILKLKSAEILRNFISDNLSFERIIDFKSYKVFKDIDTYSMILQLGNRLNKDLKFKVLTDINKFYKGGFKWETYEDFNEKKNHETINLLTQNEKRIVDTVLTQPYGLNVSTGIATLKDNLYLIDSVDEQNGTFIKKFNNDFFEIERNMVVPIEKGSNFNLKKKQYIIYPYNLVDGKAFLKTEQQIQLESPNAFKYLLHVKSLLLQRSGKYSNDNWYQYGRTQALTNFKEKILFPTNTDKPQFRLSKCPSLFYNGYAINGIKNVELTQDGLEVLLIILNSSLMDKFMKLTSYYIGGGYVSYQKKYIEKFHIPEIEDKMKEKILSARNTNEIDKLIWKIYGLENVSAN